MPSIYRVTTAGGVWDVRMSDCGELPASELIRVNVYDDQEVPKQLAPHIPESEHRQVWEIEIV